MSGKVDIQQGDSEGVPKFTELNDLTASKNGGEVLFATDDWFAGRKTKK
jgi:allantoicase